MPILVVVPLSFNAEPYFTNTGNAGFDPEAYSLRWYQDVLGLGGGSDKPRVRVGFATKNSIIIALFSTFLATTLGTLAAVGLSRSHMPMKGPIMCCSSRR